MPIARRVAARWLARQGRTAKAWDDPPDPPESPEYPQETVYEYWYPSGDPASDEGYEVSIFVDTNQDTRILGVKADEGTGPDVPVEEFEKMVPAEEMKELLEKAIESAREKAIEDWEDGASAAADAKYDAWKDEQMERKYGGYDD